MGLKLSANPPDNLQLRRGFKGSLQRPGHGKALDADTFPSCRYLTRSQVQLNGDIISGSGSNQDIKNKPILSAERQVQMIHETAKQICIEGGDFKRLTAMVKGSLVTKMLRALEYSLSQQYSSSGHEYLARSCTY